MRTVDAYRAAIFAKDIDAFAALYDRDVCVFDLWGAWSYTSLEAWRNVVATWFDSLGTERVLVDVDRVQSIVTSDVAIVHAFVTYRGLSAEGLELRTMHNRLTWALKQNEGAWKVVHEHTSAPVDFETSMVVLQR